MIIYKLKLSIEINNNKSSENITKFDINKVV